MSKLSQMSQKEKAQAAALGVLSCGFFGYFAVKMASPSPAAAGNRPAATAPAPSAATAAPSATAPAVSAAGPAVQAGATSVLAAATSGDQAPPPTPGMRDPFVPAVSGAPRAAPAAKTPAPVARVASLTGSAPMTVPVVPPLPVSALMASSASGRTLTAPAAGTPALAPLPAAPPAAPKWTATGTLQSGGERYAILRNGEARRIVRAGDAVDAEFRLAAVTRTAVILRHGPLAFTLPLGGARETPRPGAGDSARPAETPIVPPAPALPTPAAVTRNVSTDHLPQG